MSFATSSFLRGLVFISLIRDGGKLGLVEVALWHALGTINAQAQ